MATHIELTNFHTGTLFMLPKEYFVLIKPSNVARIGDTKDSPQVPRETTLQSIFNPMVTFLVKETYDQVREKMK